MPAELQRESRQERLRVLLIAEAANPRWVSVPLVGWSHARALMERVDAHLVTQVRNRDAIEEAGLVLGRDFSAIDSERLAAPLYALADRIRGGSERGWTTIAALAPLSYYYFEHLLWRRFGAAIRDRRYDVVHRLTPLSPTVPSLLAAKCAAAGVPFVLGPLNGGVPWPKEFDAVRRQEREWLSYLRGAYRLLPGHRSTLRSAAAILVGSRDTWDQLPGDCLAKCVYMPENAIDPARFTLRRQHRAARPLRVVFVGRLVPYKGADMLIEAAAPLLKAGQLRLQIIGDGPEMPRLREQVTRLGVQERVELSGWVEHTAVQKSLADADVFAFPSIREFGGGVVLEAMAVGLLPIVVAYGGPAELVTPDTGVLIPVGSRDSIVTAFREQLAHLVADPDRVEKRAEAARERVLSRFTWDAKAGVVVDVYRGVLGRGPRVSSTPGRN